MASTGYIVGPALEQDGSHEFTIEIPKTSSDTHNGSEQLLSKGVTFKITLAYTGS